MAKAPSLPQDLILDIFSRLPQKSIGRYKCLSRTYLALVSTPLFLNLCLIHKPNLILITQSHSLHLLLSTPLLNNNNAAAAISRELDFPGSWTQVVGSCQGLVLLTNKECELYLINTVISVMSKIPHFDLSLNNDESDRTHGFGYDASSDDYKIVTLSYPKNQKDLTFTGCMDTFVDVYSFKMGVWKRVDKFPFENYFLAGDPLVSGVFVNGAILWLACKRHYCRRYIFAKFDLAKEVFYGCDAPQFLNAVFKSLVGRGGSLCGVSSLYRRGGGEVWTLEKNVPVACPNVLWRESWEEFTIPITVYGDCPNVKPVCFVGEEGIVLRAKDGRLFVYHMRKGTIKEFVVDGVQARCVDMGIGSLV